MPLPLGSLDRELELLGFDRLHRDDRGRRASGEGAEDPLVVGIEVAVARPKRHEQPAWTAPELERRDECLQPPEVGYLGLKVVEPGVGVRDPATDERLGTLARGGDDLEL